MVDLIKGSGIKVVDETELLHEPDLSSLSLSPNSIFTRDAVITLPWAPHTAILCNMSLSSRKSEPEIMSRAIIKCGIRSLLKPPLDVRLEGGDVIAAEQGGKRMLYVGVGGRTNLEAAMWLAETLISKGHLDEIICIKHNRAMLHLDTCFSILPNRIILCAHDAFREGFRITADFQVTPISPAEYFNELNYQFVYIAPALAEREEGCNILFLGDDTYLSLKMHSDTASNLENLSGIRLLQIEGSEIAKANGGVHCLTQPIY
jgi:N-dimethylarginine dimethylaminohydrolase